MIEFLNNYYFLIFIAGAGGAFIADILQDNCLILPKKIDSKLSLGFIGGIILGGIAGLLVDGQLTTAFMGGFMGRELVIKLLTTNSNSLNKELSTEVTKENNL